MEEQVAALDNILVKLGKLTRHFLMDDITDSQMVAILTMFKSAKNQGALTDLFNRFFFFIMSTKIRHTLRKILPKTSLKYLRTQRALISSSYPQLTKNQHQKLQQRYPKTINTTIGTQL